MARRSDHTREELKAIIVEASKKIIASEGFEGLTARRVAKDIGYAPGTIYNLFSSMDDLYLHINGETLDLLNNTLGSPACHDPKKSSIQNMKVMTKCYMQFANKHRPFWLMLFNLDIDESSNDTSWYHEKIELLFEPLEKLLTPYFTSEQAKKKKMAARVLWSSVHGLCLLQETQRLSIVSDKETASEVASYLIDTFIAGIKK